MISQTVVAMSVAGLSVLAAGIAARWGELAHGRGLEKAIALGRVFVAAPLATFGGLHLAAAHGLMPLVPGWMPWRLFWVYFVGVALIASALSLITGKLLQWSSLLTGCMFLVFVATMDIPGVVAHPHDRFFWAVAFRETAFAAGMLALAGASSPGWKPLVTAGRILVALAALFFAAQHFLHPEFAPAVPLEMMAPAWEFAPRLWGYTMGVVLLVSGVLMLVNRWAREAAAYLGVAATVVVLLIYSPMLGPAHGTAEMVNAIDYIGDTLLFAGTALVLAESISPVRRAAVAGDCVSVPG